MFLDDEYNKMLIDTDLQRLTHWTDRYLSLVSRLGVKGQRVCDFLAERGGDVSFGELGCGAAQQGWGGQH